MFRVNIKTGGAAFDDSEEGAIEVTRILREVVDKLEDGLLSGTVQDINGNTCGSWELAPSWEEENE